MLGVCTHTHFHVYTHAQRHRKRLHLRVVGHDVKRRHSLPLLLLNAQAAGTPHSSSSDAPRRAPTPAENPQCCHSLQAGPELHGESPQAFAVSHFQLCCVTQV